jgi:hypothetical protein
MDISVKQLKTKPEGFDAVFTIAFSVKKVTKHGEVKLLKHGIRHKFAVDRSKLFYYEVRFD